MSVILRFEELIVWQKARVLNKEIYAITRNGHFSKDFALADQIRRSCISVLSNIAEGFERNGNKEFVQFLYVSKASAGEIRAQLYVAYDLGYITDDELKILITSVTEISKLISGLIKYLKNSELKGNKFNEEEIPYGTL